jgi:hypothetical protein
MAEEFVVQAHNDHGPPHFDLMIRRGGALVTWQLTLSPFEARSDRALPARRLADHRLEYLTYQGPVSGGRGSVAIADKGICQILSADESHWLIHLEGTTLRGVYRLQYTGPLPDQWTFAPASSESIPKDRP